jgi:hypothetical protein
MKLTPHCPGPRLSRRRMLQVGAAGVLGLGLPGMLRARSAATWQGTADACVIVFLNGGPSHLDTWDMKPDAPAEIRGEFKPVASTLPGVPLCEHLPRLARQMHRCTLIRSVHHGVNNAHAAAVYAALTGHDRGDTNVAIGTGANDQPAIGSVAGMVHPPQTPVAPYVSLPYITAEGAGGPPQPGFFGGILGRQRDPLFVLRDPNAPGFAMPELALGPDVDPTRFDARKQLLGGLGGGDPLRGEARAREMDAFQARAFELLTSAAAQKAFQIDREAPAVRDAYGRNIYGQSVLLARRLIEAGTRVVCISWTIMPDASILSPVALFLGDSNEKEEASKDDGPNSRPGSSPLRTHQRPRAATRRGLGAADRGQGDDGSDC